MVKVGNALMRSTRTRPSSRTRALASAMRSSDAPISARYAAPASVSSTRRLRRRNSGVPSHASSPWICRLTAPWVTCSSSPARVKLRHLAAASKARKALRGGNWRIGRVRKDHLVRHHNSIASAMPMKDAPGSMLPSMTVRSNLGRSVRTLGRQCDGGRYMTPAVISLVLCAALLHATWNAVLRSSADRLWSITMMTIASSIAAFPATLVLALPTAASWPYIVISAALHAGYNLFLVLAYREGELGQVYPIARGSSPLLITLGAALFAGEQLSLLALSGVALVSLGIVSLARGKGSARPMSLATALTTGCFIACYTVTDGIGARLAGNPQAYSAWLFLLDGLPLPLI